MSTRLTFPAVIEQGRYERTNRMSERLETRMTSLVGNELGEDKRTNRRAKSLATTLTCMVEYGEDERSNRMCNKLLFNFFMCNKIMCKGTVTEVSIAG